jgi:hypothetical protein
MQFDFDRVRYNRMVSRAELERHFYNQDIEGCIKVTALIFGLNSRQAVEKL